MICTGATEITINNFSGFTLADSLAAAFESAFVVKTYMRSKSVLSPNAATGATLACSNAPPFFILILKVSLNSTPLICPSIELISERAVSPAWQAIPSPVIATGSAGLLDALARAPEALFTRMSGSGATCFALCADQVSADRLAARLAADQPGWWVQACRFGV